MNLKSIKLVTFVCAFLTLTACNSVKLLPTSTEENANPASVFCRENSGDLKMIQASDRKVVGTCIFSDGSECDEWAYFKGECKVGDSLIKSDNNFPGLRVTYIGNAGFMITSGDKKILIDALFRGFESEYALPDDIQNKLALAQPPFDNVNLILVTHNHRDHSNRSLVLQHLENNLHAVFASQSSITSQFSMSANQLIALDPTPGKPVQKDIDGIRVEALALSHGLDQPGNIGFVITVNGVKLFFTGDIDISQISFDEFQSYKLPEEKIDIAFIQHFYLSDIQSEKQFVIQGIGAKYIIPTHYYYTNPPMDRNMVLRNYPDAIFFKNELSSWDLP